MAMNNSDFLSDAVALDLGKSGVKIAETLEIEVENEWWRLINAADVTDAKVFNKRTFPQGAVEGGELKLGNLSSKGLQMSQGWDAATVHNNRIHCIKVDEVVYYYALTYEKRIQEAYLRVWTDTEEIAKVLLTAYSYSASLLKGAYYDFANNRIVAAYRTRCGYYSFSTSSGTPSIRASSIKSSDFYTTETFPEAPGAIYSFFLSSAGGAKMKKKIPVVHENVPNQINNIFSNTDATELTAITNFSLSHGLHPFYMRAAESAAVAWVDIFSGAIGYVLESENWGTARYFPAVPDILNNSVVGLGAAMLPVDGEFLMVATRGYKTGNATKSVGYSFPENFALIGSYPLGQGVSRLFGYVGTTVHAYNLTISTMFLEYIGIATTAWPYGDVECVKIGEEGDLDLIAFMRTTGLWDVVAFRPKLGVYNRVTNQFLWFWDDYNNTSIFPYNKTSGLQEARKAGGTFHRFDDSLLFCKVFYISNSTCILESIVVPVSYIMGCTSSAEVSSTLVAFGAVRGSFTGPAANDHSMSAPGPTGSLTAILHDDSFFYVMMLENNGANPSGQLDVYTILKSNRSQFSMVDHRYVFMNSTTSGMRLLSSTLQRRDGDYLYDSKVASVAPGSDNLIRVGSTHRDGPSAIAFWDPTVRPNTITAVKCATGPETIKDYINTTIMPCLDEFGEAVTYTTYGTEMRLFGAAWDLSNKMGNDIEKWTAPFAPNFAVMDQTADAVVYFGAITNGELPYIKHSAKQGLLSGMYAIKISDATLYTITLGNVCSGGMSAFSPCGSWIAYRSISGMNRMISTGALLADGMGGEIGEGGSAELYTYEYLNRQFIPYPFAREGIRAELSNISKTTKITLPETQDHLIRGLLAAGTDFRGSRCILRRIFPDHAADEAGSDIVLLDGYIQDWSYVPEKAGIAFTVSKTLIDVGGQFPKRLMNMGCSHVFKGSRCRYLGEEGRCLKTKTFCTSLANQLQFGGFPWVAARQRRVMWK